MFFLVGFPLRLKFQLKLNMCVLGQEFLTFLNWNCLLSPPSYDFGHLLTPTSRSSVFADSEELFTPQLLLDL